MTHGLHWRRHQIGQSTTEFVVLALVLVPLLLMVPLLGKYLDLMQATETASRYGAFESVVHNSTNRWKSSGELSAETRRRVLGHPEAPVKTGDVAGDFTEHRNPVWTDHTGRPFVSEFDPGVIAIGRAAEKDFLPAAPLSSALGLSRKNYQTATVTVQSGLIPELPPFDTLKVTITRRVALLSDTWAAKDASQVRSRISSSASVYPVTLLTPILEPIGLLHTTVLDPALEVGDFDWDVVPCDRLSEGC